MAEFVSGEDRIHIRLSNFEDIKLSYESYCGYYIDTRLPCPLIFEDIRQTAGGKKVHVNNFNVYVCIYLCSHFRRINIPEIAEMNYKEDDINNE